MVSFVYDTFLQDKDETILVFNLDDGTQVYQDDGRNGPEDIFFYRFREWLKESGRKVVGIDVKWRSNYKVLLGEYPHYYYCRGMAGFVGGTLSESFAFGYSEDGKTYKVRQVTHRFLDIIEHDGVIEEKEYNIKGIDERKLLQPPKKRGRKKKD